ncbi:DUF4352 domain-containing protein [Haladaptatus sp. CMAA 1911]|uniref:DUF4352 domain-containing protein n=1 Tax=unclassified Haladaptatus TaxID=2622732 RepID=UPI0037552D80
MERREFIAIVCTGLGIGVAGCSSSGDSDEETSTTEISTTAQQTTRRTTQTTTASTETTTTEAGTTDRQTTSKTLTLGETATFESGLTGTVQKFQFKSEYEGSETTESTDQSFLFVKFRVTNPTDSSQDIPSNMSIYVSVGGNRYDPVDYKGAVRSLYTTGSLKGGATRSGTLIFEVPDGTEQSDVAAFLKYSSSDGKKTLQWTSE